MTGGQEAASAARLGETLPFAWVIPFAALILGIAILPLAVPHWWDRLRNRALVAFGLALPVGIFLILNGPGELLRTAEEYVQFIALLASLFIISGGIVLSGDLRATPGVNTAFLGIGAVLANLVGTTGASMLLIRPVLQTNSERSRILHIPIFFIFLVSNIGGCLTPLGDPPLFLGFLRGVPFFWTLRLLPEWLFMVGAVLVVFYFVDTWAVRHESRAALRLDLLRYEPLRIEGAHNFAFLGGVILSLFLPAHLSWLRPIVMGLMAWGSYRTTPKENHRKNRFSFFAINDVAILFAGLFVTMVPALLILEARGAEFGIRAPWQFFWLTGGLSSFLDNAPTYLTFSSLAIGVEHAPIIPGTPLLALVNHESGQELLQAISLGAVFMGANSYIGNAPNFMVKSISEEREIPMPSFFGYMAWSVGILVPLFLLVTVLFLR